MNAPSGHSKLPPSSAFRWRRCTASIGFVEENDAILPPSGGKEADEGTRAHAYLTATLKHTLGQVPDNEEMRVTIGKLVEFIHSLIRPGDKLYVDQRVPLFYLPTEFGTLDVAIVGADRIVVLDLKYGVGVGVYAEDNDQLACYAESYIRKLEEIETISSDLPVDLIIWQPRDRNDPEALRRWPVTRKHLADFCVPIQQAAADIQAKRNLKFEPGIACKFCRATGICKAYGTQGLAVIEDAPVDVVLSKPLIMPKADGLTREQRQRILRHKGQMIEFLEAVENQEVAELLHGAAPIEFKLVEGKANRQWADKEKAVALLRGHFPQDVICPPLTPELRSPKQIEDLLKMVKTDEEFKVKLHALIEKPTGKPTLVPVTDKRPALLLKPLEGLSKISEYDPRDLV